MKVESPNPFVVEPSLYIAPPWAVLVAWAVFLTNLPVILLRGLILLQNNEIRLEFDNDLSKNIIDVSELFHDNMLLVVSSLNPLEEIPNENDLPSVGVVSKIVNKIELPNGKTRVIIKGINRAYINEYLNLKHHLIAYQNQDLKILLFRLRYNISAFL